MSTSSSGSVSSNSNNQIYTNQDAVGGVSQGADPYNPDPIADMPTMQVAATGTNKGGGGGGASSVDAYDPNSAQAIEQAEIQQEIEDEEILASSNSTNTTPTVAATGTDPLSVFSKGADKEQGSKVINPNAVGNAQQTTASNDAIDHAAKAHRRNMRHRTGAVGG